MGVHSYLDTLLALLHHGALTSLSPRNSTKKNLEFLDRGLRCIYNTNESIYQFPSAVPVKLGRFEPELKHHRRSVQATLVYGK